MSKQTLTIEFENKDAALHFMHWLDGQGESDYWDWMSFQQDSPETLITAHNIQYDWKNCHIKASAE